MAVDATVALVTLADTKAFLKITASTEDTILETLVNAVSVLVSNYLGRKLVSAAFTEYYDGDGSDTLVLNQFPVTALSSINDDPTRTFAGSTEVVIARDTILDGNAGIVRVWNGKPAFIYGRSNIKVTYTAGYTAGSNVPADLMLAVKLTIEQIYKNRYAAQRFGVKTETIADRTISFDYEAFPSEAVQILDHYRQMFNERGGIS